MGTARCEVVKNGQLLNVSVNGSLDEDVVLPELNCDGIDVINFDFSMLSIINSCGIRDWIAWLKSVPATTQLLYKNCPVILIDQINMVEGLIRAGSIIESFFIPYYCESCDYITNLKVDNKNISSWKDFQPEEFYVCDKCSEKVEIDVIESKYFKFLKRF